MALDPAKDTEVTNTMIDTVTTVTTDPNPCEATNCDMVDSPVSACRKRGCGFEWSKTARIDRARRELADAKERAEG